MPWDPLSEEQREIRELVRTLTRERIAPRAAEIDESGDFPWDMVELLREHEIFGLAFDERHGGANAGALMLLVAVEEISKADATVGLILAVQELSSLALRLAGTEEQRDRFLPKIASGEWIAAYALTEPGSGSDAAAMRTEAKRDGDEYVLNGSKRFITNAGVAHLYTVFAKTDPSAGHDGISCFMVESDAPGFRGRPDRAEARDQGLDHRRGLLQRLPRAGGESHRERGRGLQDRDADPRPLAAWDCRPGARDRPGRDRLCARLRPVAGRPWASRSSSTR